MSGEGPVNAMDMQPHDHVSERARSERGSALILTLMVMVIMTVLGLSFLVVSDVENDIAINDRDSRQALYVALSGATLVESWFNVPDAAYNPFVPDKDDCDLDLRVGDSDYDGDDDLDVPTNGSAQRYRGGTATGTYRLFDKPFRGHPRDTFWGARDTPDVLIVNDPEVDDDFLDRVGLLFNTDGSPSLEGVQLEEIRIYAPPFDRELQRRFGICTAEITAGKVIERAGRRTRLSQRTISIVLQEMPFPVSGSAIESTANVDVSGNFGVHWGGTYTEADLDLQQGANFPGNGIPRENTSRNRYANFSPAAPDLDLALGGPQNLLTKLLAGPAEIVDPWINFRAGGQIDNAPNADDQPWQFDYWANLDEDRSIFFQNQTYSFPELEYEFWKKFTQLRGRNANYFKFTGLDGDEAQFARNGAGTSHPFAHWVNTENAGIEPGIFFFDTTNALDPQNGGTGVLVPELMINAAAVDSTSGDFIMEGLIYSNFALVDSSGIGGKAVTKRVNMPAEPFLDVGIDIDRNGVVGNTLEEQETVGNGIWDFAYFGSTESDGQYYDEHYGTPEFEAFVADNQFADGEVPHSGDDPTLLADIVHEPYLNFAYPAEDAPDDTISVDYDFELTTERKQGGDRDEDNVEDVMTSVRDRKGAMVELDIIVNGIWYNEGRYEGTGNLPAYGSLLMKGGFQATGTPDVYYNEGIATGDFPPPEMQIPRVYTSQVETD